MASTFRLEVISPERVALETDVESLTVPGDQGYLGVLSNHAPMVVTLRPGVVTARHGDERRRMAVTGGFLEVAAGRALLLARTVELPEEIDISRAEAARKRAMERLKGHRRAKVDEARAQAALQRALVRLKVAEPQRF